MSDPNPNVSIAIDLKKYRIRLHKATLHLLGDPDYVQLLVNPTSKVVAIKGTQTSLSNDSVHKIYKHVLRSDNSVEIYSRLFISTLLDVAGIKSDDQLIRLDGEIISSERMAVFSLESLSNNR